MCWSDRIRCTGVWSWWKVIIIFCASRTKDDKKAAPRVYCSPPAHPHLKTWWSACKAPGEGCRMRRQRVLCWLAGGVCGCCKSWETSVVSRAQAFGICMLPAGPRKCDLPSLAANARPSFDHQMISDFQISPNKEAGKGKVDSLSFCSNTPTKKLLFMSLPSIWNSIGTFSTFFCITNYCIDGQGGCWMIGLDWCWVGW